MRHQGSTILAVDDKQTNLLMLETMLQAEGFTVETAGEGAHAWELLEDHGERFQAILLDRIMPHMSGLELLQKIKNHPSLKVIPVIMQTSADTAHEVLEGIEAGAYYYLTKPYQKKILLGVVQSALKDFKTQQALQIEVQQNARTWSFLESGVFRFRTLKEARELAPLIANSCPQPERVVFGLGELLGNAVEHGNLQISYEEKSQLEEEDQLDAEIERRLTLPEYADKTVEVTFLRREGCIEISVKDQGKGFNWERYLALDEKRAFDSHGRGIAMAKVMSFDKLEYQGNGNHVICTIFNSPQPSSESVMAVGAMAS